MSLFKTYGGDPPVPEPPPNQPKHMKNLLFILIFLMTHSRAGTGNLSFVWMAYCQTSQGNLNPLGRGRPSWGRWVDISNLHQ